MRAVYYSGAVYIGEMACPLALIFKKTLLLCYDNRN